MKGSKGPCRFVKFKTFFEIQFRRDIIALHKTNNASVAISLGVPGFDLDRSVEVNHGPIEIALLRQQVSAIVIEPRMLFESYGFAQIGYRFNKAVQSVERHAAEIKAVLEAWAIQLDRLSEVADGAFEIVLFKTADTALGKIIR